MVINFKVFPLIAWHTRTRSYHANGSACFLSTAISFTAAFQILPIHFASPIMATACYLLKHITFYPSAFSSLLISLVRSLSLSHSSILKPSNTLPLVFPHASDGGRQGLAWMSMQILNIEFSVDAVEKRSFNYGMMKIPSLFIRIFFPFLRLARLPYLHEEYEKMHFAMVALGVWV
jgi:hypothetical protein